MNDTAELTPTPKAKTPKAPRKASTKTEKAPRKAMTLPTSLKELKNSKAGLVAFLFLSAKDKEESIVELKKAFNLSDEQAAKTVRRHLSRARFFLRAFELVAGRKPAA